MFILKDYIKKGFLEAIGKMGDYQIILNSAGWFEKGVLTEEDLAEIQSAIDAQYPQPDYPEDIVSNGIIEDGTLEESTETIEETETVETEVIS